MTTVRIAAETLRDFLERIFLAAGCSPANAAITAEGVLEADLRGHRIQGTDHIFSIVRDLKSGQLNGRAEPRILRETAATAQVHGDGATGFVAGRFATDLAIAKAKAAGIGTVGVVAGGDIFMLGGYVDRMARAGMAGMTFTNTIPARVHAAGGIDRVLGTNPVGFGFPVAGGDPIVVDFATSSSAVGHIRIASYSDGPIPEGVAIDRDGRPTTNAKAALEGALTPLGGHKGFGLALAAALLSGPLIGAIIGEDIKQAMAEAKSIPERGHLFIAIDPAAFGDSALCLERTRRYADEIKAGRKASGVEEILLPGERSLRARRRSVAEGVELLESVWEHTLAIARELEVEPPRLQTKA